MSAIASVNPEFHPHQVLLADVSRGSRVPGRDTCTGTPEHALHQSVARDQDENVNVYLSIYLFTHEEGKPESTGALALDFLHPICRGFNHSRGDGRLSLCVRLRFTLPLPSFFTTTHTHTHTYAP